ncbi:hypothetical protein [Anaerovorax odorimutans]|uniref:hypothetical protein n=1 Tax=Anaerovorax odorimutans TaxID=109327 RepID=UPI0004288F9E|nr:hypothetical protein [Anaerovorax odorimutans]
MRKFKQLQITNSLNIIAVIYAVLIIWLGDYILFVLAGDNYNFIAEFIPRVVKTFLIYLPFGLFFKFTKNTLKIKDIFHGLIPSCLVGWIVSIFLWGCYYYENFTYIIYDKIGEVNIGMEILLLISPIIVTLLMFGVYFISNKIYRNIYE